ncbi:MAG: hypothetical protein GXO57_08630 [Thermodesulfobacteria bacterium]|nr:hypothetical protein [Thermodesulfobacteriota bacterium]
MLGKKKKRLGFSLVEVLIATFILFITIIGATKLVTYFGIYNKKREILSCLVNAATSGINSCKAGAPISTVNCNGLTIAVTIIGNCNPPLGTCSYITATASYGSENFSLENEVCNFD